MKVLVVDDEPLARQRLNRLVAKIEGYEVIAEAENGQQAIEQVNQHEPDIVLLDIRMPLMDGLAAAKAVAVLERPPAVIFCTAYDDYALEAFDANAVGYLLKPVNREKLALALNKAQRLNRSQLAQLHSEEAALEPRQFISARSARGIELIAVSDVRYFLADHKYVTVFYCRDGELQETLIDDTLKELESSLGEQFMRLHRNALVAMAHLQGLEKHGQQHRVKLQGVAEGPLVSRRHLPELRQLLMHL